MRQPIKLLHKHWSKGGTGLCNFRKEDLPHYQAAVKEFGCPHLVIHEYPIGPVAMQSDHSLHDLVKRRNMSVFWAIFNKRKREIEENGYN